MRRFLIFVGGTLAGSGIGAGISLLFAPQSGDEMRASIKTRFKRIQENSVSAADEYEAQLRHELAELTGKSLPTEKEI